MDNKSNESACIEKNISDANKCMAIGVGVGGLGTAAALTLGATCPLCFIIAPALIGVGLVKRIREKRNLAKCAVSLEDAK